MAINKTPEQRAAELVDRLEKVFEGDDSLPNLIDRVKAIQKEVKELKDLKPETISSEIEKLRAGQETLIKRIRFSKGGLYVPGLEDEKFSMLKAMVAIKSGKWDDAGREKSIMDAVRQKAGQVIGDDSRGGFFVPDQVIPEVIGAIYTKSVFVSLAGEGQTRISVIDGLTGGNVKIPKFDGGLIAYWIGEEDEYAESEATVGDVTMNPRKMGVLVKLTDSMRRFQGYGFETLLRNDMVRAAAKKLDWTIMYGTGSNDMPKGISKHNIKVYSTETGVVYANPTDAAADTDWDGGELTYGGLSKMLLGLEEDNIDLDESAVWISAPRYFQRLSDLRTAYYSAMTEEKPYILGAPMLTPERLAGIIGPFAKSNQFPTTNTPGLTLGLTGGNSDAKYTDVLGGNLNNVLLGRWGGLEIEDDAGRGKGFTSDHTYVKCRLYADVGVRQERGLIIAPDVKIRD